LEARYYEICDSHSEKMFKIQKNVIGIVTGYRSRDSFRILLSCDCAL